MMKPTNNKRHGYADVTALAVNTRIAYSKGWACFQDYCEEKGANPLAVTPEQMSEFFLELGSRAPSSGGQPLSMRTLVLYRSAINRRYVEANRPSPTHHPQVRAVLKGLARRYGTAPRRVQALREHHILCMLEHCGESLIGLRNAALLALGFSAALRRSELCILRTEDIEILPPLPGEESRKMLVHIRRSKTDQEGQGQRIAIPEGRWIQPIKRLEAWLRGSGIRRGYVFQTMSRDGSLRGRPLHHSDIPRLVKHYAKAIGLNPDEVAGHSLRAGFVTSAAVHHARMDKIMEITRHKDPETVMRYIRDVELFRDHAGEKFL